MATSLTTSRLIIRHAAKLVDEKSQVIISFIERTKPFIVLWLKGMQLTLVLR